MNGVVTLMSNDNGKCIDTCLLSKGCKDCHHWKGKERKIGISRRHEGCWSN